jgi:hypothetical protein
MTRTTKCELDAPMLTYGTQQSIKRFTLQGMENIVVLETVIFRLFSVFGQDKKTDYT